MFGFGASKSDARSQSTSSGDSLNLSNSQSSDLSQSISRAGGASSSWQDVAFGDLFQQLYGGASGAAGKLAGAMPAFSDQVSSLFSGGLSTLNSLGGGAGADYMTSRLTDTSNLGSQIGALGSDLGDFWNQQLNPSMNLGSVVNGTMGGDRSEVARGSAAAQIAKQFQGGAAQLRSADQAQKDQLAQQLAGNQLGAGVAGLNALPGLMGIAQGGATSSMLPYSMLASIMGGPTVLGGSQASNFANADAFSIAQAIANSFGISHDESQSTSMNRSRSISVGAGGGGGG
jgi:hypothetical protein